MNKSAYNSWHEEMRSKSDHVDPMSFAWHRAVVAHVDRRPYGNLLEIDCGRGEFARYMANAYPQMTITALDFSESAIAIAEQRFCSMDNSPRYLVGNALALPFSGRSFDWVVSCECMEHVADPQIMANEIYRVLAPGGRFCLTTENYFNGMLIAWLQCWLTGQPFNSGSGVQPRENFFLFWMVERFLRRAGLVVEGTESCHYQWLLLPKVDPARLCTEQFQSKWAQRLVRPFGRHFTFYGRRAQ